MKIRSKWKGVIFLVALLALLAGVFATSVSAVSIQYVYYDFDAAENQNALVVQWTGKPAFEIKANEFYLDKKETTTADVEARIQLKFNDLLVEDVKLTTYDADDECRQDPPILGPGEDIVIIRNSEYLRIHKAFFAIRVFELDDLETPESELKFLTRFQRPDAGPIPDGWWQ